MPTCQNCGSTWTWKESIKASWKISGSMSCSHCQSHQYATAKSRQRMTLINWLILIPLPIAAIIDLPLFFTISMMLVLFAVAMLLILKSLDLSNKREPMW